MAGDVTGGVVVAGGVTMGGVVVAGGVTTGGVEVEVSHGGSGGFGCDTGGLGAW